MILSLFMSKQAREKMDAFHARQRGEPLDTGTSPSTSVESEPLPLTSPMPTVLTEEELAKAVEAAVTRIDTAEKQAAIVNMLQGHAERSASPRGRAELIKKAIAIHKQKQTVLDELDDEARKKLSDMAMQAFFSDKS